jgi:acyl transferase domain-containing protein/acyl carrier protein
LKTSAPVAIVGIGCRFPGASGVEEFWRVLRDGLETTIDYPGGRFPAIDRVYAAADRIATRRGGFLRNLDEFDAEFFGISPREAAQLDPHQRLLLEVAWEAIEDAGIPAEKIAGTETGVFTGVWTSDYERTLYEQNGGPDFYSTTGGGRYSASGRLAYFLDLRGPSLTLDTACSSSLVAIHLACQSLRLGESEMALAGGANVILTPEITLTYSAANMLSPDGRSKFGDASADGYVRSEGAGLVLLKLLDRAMADGDPIYAVIRGSAVNNDGHSSGLLISPSREGQEAMLRTALRNADLDPGTIDYVEAHGTGTLVGDPVEIETIGRVVNTPGRQRPCAIGSVKTNIGHTESAAGAAGVIKVALSLERGTLPASLHYREPNPAIAWNQLPVKVQSATTAWPHSRPQRLAGVSGFGITGTNAHVVLENLTEKRDAVRSAPDSENREHLFVLSAHSARSLKAVAQSWRDRLQSDSAWPASLTDLAYTAGVRRTHQEYRLAIVAASRAELDEKLAAWLQGEEAEGVRDGQRRSGMSGKAVFVFPGQGGQWHGMARGLMREPVFRSTLEECDAAIRKHTGWSVVERLMAAEMPENIAAVQPCLFAVMAALTALWRSWGIKPQAVVGHSMGECAAAWACGALSLDDATAVICSRSRLMERTSGRGLMAFAELTLDDATALVQQYNGRLSVAANNSSISTVLSGDPDAIEDALRQLTEREIFCRRVKVDVASHSSHMEPLRPELEQMLRDLHPRTGAVPMYSTTSGNTEDGSGLDAAYWSRNLRQPVLFSSAVQGLLRDGFDTFVEINSHPVLLQSIESGIKDSGKDAVAVTSTRRERNERAEMLSSLGALYVAGFPVDLRCLYPEGVCLRLPPYQWQRERHWIEVADVRLHEAAVMGNVAPVRDVAAERSCDAYCITWTEDTAAKESVTGGLWIVAGAGSAEADALASELRAAGHQCIIVSSIGELGHALETTGSMCRGVIRVSNEAGKAPQGASAEAWDLVKTVRAVTSAPSPARLWLVSTGLWSLPGDHTIRAAQSSAWGMGRVIEHEYPELRCVNVDLPASTQPMDFVALARLVAHNEAEEPRAIRGGKHFVARYERMPAKENATTAFRADASYLITGGMGGIGLHLAHWLAQNGARHIALVARRTPDDAARARIQAIESIGPTVRVFQADMASDGDTARVLDAIRNEMPPLKGVFHLAAAYEPGLLANLDQKTLERVMRSKADAAWSLDRHLEGVELDFFVLFSSIAAAISQPGLGAYASANAYVEALARDRRARGLKAQSVAWGSWTSTGLSTVDAVSKGVSVYEQRGIHPVSVDVALRDLGRIMTLDATNVLALPVSWEQFAQSFESPPSRIYERLLPQRKEAAPESIREQLEAIEPARRRAVLETRLTEKLAGVLKTSAARIDPARPFGLLGLDSLMALEFARRLAVTTSLRLPVAMIFNYSTIQTLAREIAKRMGVPLEETTAVVSAPTSAESRPEPPVEALTDEEAIEALMGKGGQ